MMITPFTKIAWRNIARNKLRCVFTVSAVACGLCALIFIRGFIDGAGRQMIEGSTDLMTASIQIHRTGFMKNMNPENSIAHAVVITSNFNKVPGILAFAPRVKSHALISSPEGSAGILLLGVDPVRERKVSTINRRVRSGSFLDKADDKKILLGKILAEKLKTGLGAKVVLKGRASDGSEATATFEVCGIVDSGVEEIDRNSALITLKAAQELLAMGGKVSEIAIKTASPEHIDAVAGMLNDKINTRRFEILTWKEVSPAAYHRLQFIRLLTDAVLCIVLLLVATGILSAVLAGVSERKSEFGIMLALGTKPAQIKNMVSLESLFLGVVGAAIGALAGAGLVVFFAANGVNLSFVSSALNNFYTGPVIYPLFDGLNIAFYASSVVLVSFFVSVFPARKASRLAAREALRHT